MRQKHIMTSAEYFAMDNYASNSGMKEAHQMFLANDRGSHDPTQAYAFGSALDAIVTDPDELDTSLLTDKVVGNLVPMRRAVQRDNTYRALMANAETQVVFIDDEFPVSFDGINTTVKAKCKFDFWNEIFGPTKYFGSDLKSTTATTKKQFLAAAHMFNYPMQGAWYMDITKSDRFVILAVSKINYKIFHISINRGDELYEKGKASYLYYIKSWWKFYGIL